MHPIHVKVKGIAVKPEVSTRVPASVGLLVSTVKLVRTNNETRPNKLDTLSTHVYIGNWVLLGYYY